MEVTGKVHQIFPTQQVTDTFSKRELVLMYAENPMYPQYPKFEFHKDKCSLLDNFKPGDEVQVGFDLNGREHTDKSTGEVKYFTTLKAFYIKKVGEGQSAAQPSQSATTTPSTAPESGSPATQTPQEGEDDLPF